MFQQCSLCARRGRRVRAPGLQEAMLSGHRPGGLTRRLAITHISCWQGVNPKGIPSQSPGLRGTSYPGCDRSKEPPTLKGLQRLTRTAAARHKPAPCCNPFRVERGSGTQPRVARSSQPWAEGYNPFGIEKRQADLWVMVTMQPRVARSSQPWAGRYNPLGIEKRQADLRAMASPAWIDRAVKTTAEHV